MESYNVIEKNKKKNIFFKSVPFCIEKEKIKEAAPIHIHDFSQLTVVTGGRGKIVVNGHEESIKEGEVYVINNFTPHTVKSAEALEITNILFYIEDLLKYVGTLKSCSGFQTMFILQASLNNETGLTSKLLFSYEDLAYTQKIITYLLQEIKENEPGYEMMVQSYFLILITFISRAYEKKNLAEDYQTGKLYKAVAYMEENIKNNISLEVLSEITCLSERQFRRIFTDKYGVSPSQYFSYLRMRQACYLLKNTEMQIADVAMETGFLDQNYFSRQFKKQIGLTPKEFRKIKNI